MGCACLGGTSRIKENEGDDWGVVRKSLVLKYIPKGKGSHIYPLSRIFGYAKEWEKPLIEETEKELAWIRREAFHLNKALFSIRYAKVAAMQGEVVEE